ncbi:MAG TPA: tetratricopeptide repeat protein [Methylocella sp.]|nr:tetratricopeptide repeat protein [Methylocella sp.]
MGILQFARKHGEPAGTLHWNGRESSAQPRCRRLWAVSSVLLCAALFATPASADRLHDGIRAFVTHNYVKAATIFTELAPHGNPIAQTYLGYMYANGKGVPQDFFVSAGWYRCASQQGVARAQYQLGLMYDKAQGVPQDYVKAYALVNLAVAKAGPEREVWVKIRDAIASKLSLVERTQAQQMAFEGVPEVPCLPIVTSVQVPPFPLIAPNIIP